MIPRIVLLLRLATRNLLRQARRTTLSASAMIAGGAVLMISLSLGDGSHEQWITSGVRMGTGHIALQHPQYQSGRRIEDRMSATIRAAAESALAQPQVARRLVTYVPRLSVGGLASSAASARPAEIIGVDPAAEAEFSMLDERVKIGRYLRPGDHLAAYVGAGLAESLELDAGSRLVLTAQDAEGEISGQLVRVVGIFESGIPEVDESIVHIPLSTAGSWLRTDAGVTTVAVLLESSRQVPPVTRLLERDLARRADPDSVAVLSWGEAMPGLYAGVRLDDFGNYLFQGILFAIIALGIVNTVLMSVLHRTREFGLLQALGLPPEGTGGMVVVEGVILTALSGLIGVGLGLFITWLFWRDGLDLSAAWSEDITFSGVVIDPVIVPAFRLARVIQALVLIGLIGVLASLYPAYRATRIEVAEAMKFER